MTATELTGPRARRGLAGHARDLAQLRQVRGAHRPAHPGVPPPAYLRSPSVHAALPRSSGAHRPAGQLHRSRLGRHEDRDRGPRPGLRRRRRRPAARHPRADRRHDPHPPGRRRPAPGAPGRRGLPADRRAVAGHRRAGAVPPDLGRAQRQADPAPRRPLGPAQRRRLGAVLPRAPRRHARAAHRPRDRRQGVRSGCSTGCWSAASTRSSSPRRTPRRSSRPSPTPSAARWCASRWASTSTRSARGRRGAGADDGTIRLAHVGRMSREKSPQLAVATAVELHRRGRPGDHGRLRRRPAPRRDPGGRGGRSRPVPRVRRRARRPEPAASPPRTCPCRCARARPSGWRSSRPWPAARRSSPPTAAAPASSSTTRPARGARPTPGALADAVERLALRPARSAGPRRAAASRGVPVVTDRRADAGRPRPRRDLVGKTA